MRLIVVVVAGALAAALPARAEEPPKDAKASGTTLSLQVGLTSGGMDMAGAALGGSVVRDLGSRLSIEGSVASLGHAMDGGSFNASASLLFHLRPAGENTVPYLSVGGGVYRGSDDMMGGGRAREAMDGSGMTHGSGLTGSPGTMGPGYMPATGPNPGYAGHMSQFQGSRDGRMDGDRDRMGRGGWATEPVLSLGGGVRIDVGRNLFVRPDGRALVVVGDGGTHTAGVVAVNFGWKF